MANEYICVTGQDEEIYEIRPTDGLLSFLQRLAEEEMAEQEDQKKNYGVEMSHPMTEE